MTTLQTPTARLQAFAHLLGEQTAGASFNGPIAQDYWKAMKTTARSGQQALLAAAPALRVHNGSDLEAFTDLLDFSAEALAWAQDEELAYIEALTETATLLHDRLRQHGLLPAA